METIASFTVINIAIGAIKDLGLGVIWQPYHNLEELSGTIDICGIEYLHLLEIGGTTFINKSIT